LQFAVHLTVHLVNAVQHRPSGVSAMSPGYLIQIVVIFERIANKYGSNRPLGDCRLRIDN
jgi:hypothetical protein